MQEYKVILETINNSNEILNKFFLVIGPILGVVVQSVIQLIDGKRKERKKLNKLRYEQIKNELDNFYYPILQLIRKNKILFEVFTNNKNEHFKTLVELANGYNFSHNDLSILKEIVNVDKQINEIILKYKHYIKDNIELSKIINEASVHFTLMEMAYNKEIKAESNRFEQYIYPLDFEDEIEKRIYELNKRIKSED